MTAKEELILRLSRDRVIAHAVLFKHRHPDNTPDFHKELIDLWHSAAPHVLAMAFREAGKSTIAEEAIVTAAQFQLFRNGIIVGATEKRAVERLRAVKHEIETNDYLLDLFGPMGGPAAEIWNEAEVILANGVRIVAVGRGQSLRGTKHLHYRPDFCFCDDIEEVEKDQMYTADMAQETLRWFMKVLLPALDKRSRVRINATPLSKEALPMVLKEQPDWISKIYPIEYKTPEGERRATWPARYPLDWIDGKKASFERVGMLHEYMQEYMCEAEDPAEKTFTPGMFTVEAHQHVWQPTYAFYDPARTVNSGSASTGWVVWSWVGNKMIVWDGGGEMWKPDQMIAHIFETALKYNPIEIGVEEDGLNEFVKQPLRQESIRRGMMIPFAPYKAPRGKLGFIRALQPLFQAKEIVFAKDLPMLKAQFLAFPGGRIDGPNALAYALRMRPGQVIYEDFGAMHVFTELPVFSSVPVYLAFNATGGMTTAVACQFTRGVLRVVADWVREGDPGATLADIVREASVELGPVKLVAGPRHFEQYDTVGLRGAAAKMPIEIQKGGPEGQGRDEIRAMMRVQVRSAAAFQIAARASWTLNALAAGYAREIGKDGRVKDTARAGVYRTLVEGLEAFSSLLRGGILEDRGGVNVQRTPAGQRYISALPGRTGVLDAKDAFPSAGVVSEPLTALRR